MAESRVTAPVPKLMPKNGCTMNFDRSVSASRSEAFHAVASNGCGISTWPDVARRPAASSAALNWVTVRPTKPACSTRR